MDLVNWAGTVNYYYYFVKGGDIAISGLLSIKTKRGKGRGVKVE